MIVYYLMETLQLYFLVIQQLGIIIPLIVKFILELLLIQHIVVVILHLVEYLEELPQDITVEQLLV
jgi:hypothetical protein